MALKLIAQLIIWLSAGGGVLCKDRLIIFKEIDYAPVSTVFYRDDRS